MLRPVQSPIRVLIAEDHPVVLEGLQAMLGKEADMEVVAAVERGQDVVPTAMTVEPTVAVLPLRISGARRGISLCRELKQRGGCAVVIFTSFAREIDVILALLAGADAIIYKSAPADVMTAAIRGAGKGEPIIYLESGATMPELVPMREAFTDREQEILALMADGLTNAQMAEALSIEMTTVKTHARNILRKLGVTSRRELLA